MPAEALLPRGVSRNCAGSLVAYQQWYTCSLAFDYRNHRFCRLPIISVLCKEPTKMMVWVVNGRVDPMELSNVPDIMAAEPCAK